MNRIFFDFQQRSGETVILRTEQIHYLKNVLRLKKGARFIALDGRGNSWLAGFENDSALLLETLQESSESPVNVTLMVGIPKNGFDDIVRATTELGVSKIIPLLTDRGSVNPGQNKVERWRKISLEAAEQSERQIIPIVESPLSFDDAIKTLPSPESRRYICVTRLEVDSLFSRLLPEPAGIIIAIGAEGGWAEKEIEKAIECDFIPVSLGKRILRTITAPLVAMTTVNLYFDR